MKDAKQRAQESKERDDARKRLTPAQQAAILDERLGKGQGAQKERKRLARLAGK